MRNKNRAAWAVFSGSLLSGVLVTALVVIPVLEAVCGWDAHREVTLPVLLGSGGLVGIVTVVAGTYLRMREKG